MKKISTFLNWHKPAKWYKCKRRELSNVFPVSVYLNTNKAAAELSFTDEAGSKITFYLQDEEVQRLKLALENY